MIKIIFTLPKCRYLRYASICIFHFAICISASAQIERTYHWYFGAGAGIDFSSGTAVADTNGAMYVEEGSACISDTLGNLLFYTDGKTIWNRNHNIMPNGSGLLVTGTPAQSSVIVPNHKYNNIYYVFTADGFQGGDTLA